MPNTTEPTKMEWWKAKFDERFGKGNFVFDAVGAKNYLVIKKYISEFIEAERLLAEREVRERIAGEINQLELKKFEFADWNCNDAASQGQQDAKSRILNLLKP